MTGYMKRLLFLALVLSIIAVGSSSALAQEVAEVGAGGCGGEADEKDDMGSFRKIVGPDGSVTYEYMGVVRVCGKVPVPQVVAILLEKTIEYEWENLKQDFLPKIHNTVKKAPF